MEIKANDIKKIVVNNVENVHILVEAFELLRKHEGKKFTKIYLGRLEKVIGVSIQIVREYGMIFLRFGSETILLAHGNLLPDIDVDEIHKKNPAYFSGAVKRNKMREEVLDSDDLVAATDAINRYNTAISAANKAKREYERFVGYDGSLHQDRHEIDALILNKC